MLIRQMSLPSEQKKRRYFPPCTVILQGLGITRPDLDGDRVTVSTAYLRFLLGRIAGLVEVDEEWYRRRSPDVFGAKLANEVPSYQVHFEMSGYMEGRLPYEMTFDGDWYFETYKDLQNALGRDFDAMITHFRTTGYYEGRAGNADDFAAAESWRLGYMVLP
jgi:hypothetical protein